MNNNFRNPNNNNGNMTTIIQIGNNGNYVNVFNNGVPNNQPNGMFQP